MIVKPWHAHYSTVMWWYVHAVGVCIMIITVWLYIHISTHTVLWVIITLKPREVSNACDFCVTVCRPRSCAGGVSIETRACCNSCAMICSTLTSFINLWEPPRREPQRKRCKVSKVFDLTQDSRCKPPIRPH